MKKIVRFGLCVALMMLVGACSRHKIIPDSKLAQIFHDAFLTNAYIGNESLRLDSLNLYEPIFASYGYTTADVQYTIGNFSKRKSARLGDVVELAIKQLEAEGDHYTKEVAVLDTVDNVARRAFTRVVRADSVLRVRALRDTARMRFAIDVQPGEYNVRMNYFIDSLDQNEAGVRGGVWLEKCDSTKTSSYIISLRRNYRDNFTRRVVVDSTIRRLWVHMLEFREKPKRPSMTVTDLEITYTPPTEAAVDSLYRKQLDIRIFADEFFRAANPKDSL